MLGAVSALCWYHPARYLPSMSSKMAKMAGNGSEELGSADGVELRGVEKEGRRFAKGWRR